MVQIQHQLFQPRSKTGRKGAGPNAFPRGPPGNELFRAELGCGQRSSGELDQDMGLRTLGSTVAHILLLCHLSSNAPRQRLEWIQSSRPSLQKLAGEGKRDREDLEAFSAASPRGICSLGVPSNLGLSVEIESKGDVCTWLSIAPHKRTHPGDSVRKAVRVPAARLPRVVPDALLQGALTAAAALPWGPASRRRGTDNELLASLPAQLASVEPAGSAGARARSSAWARGGEGAPGLLSLRVPE